MTLTLELTPQEEAVLNQQASVRNIDVNILVRARLVGVEEASLPTAKHSGLAAILQSWIEEEATDNPAQTKKAEEETAELLQNLQANRVDLGEEPTKEAGMSAIMSAEEVCSEGERIYECELRAQFSAVDQGKYVIIEVEERRL